MQCELLAAINFYNVAHAVTGAVEVAINGFDTTLTTAAAGRQRDAIAENLKILREGTGRPLAEVLSIPEVDRPLTRRDVRIWADAEALLERNDLDSALLVLLGAREAAV